MSNYHNRNIFHHLKLEIASTIPASNEWKIETNSSAEQGLRDNHFAAAARYIYTVHVFKPNKMLLKLTEYLVHVVNPWSDELICKKHLNQRVFSP